MVWFLHRSHHEPHLDAVETNDVYLLVLALVAISLIVLGNAGRDPLQWIGAGVAASTPRHPYLRRLYQAHLVHHAVKGRRNSVSFGFLYAPPVHELKH